MEDILDLYHFASNPDHPLVCFDESSQQLVAEKRIPVSAKPGQLEWYDDESRLNGVRNLFLFFWPVVCWRHVKVTKQRTPVEWEDCMKELVNLDSPNAIRIGVISDNLHTHNPAFLSAVFEPAEAKRI